MIENVMLSRAKARLHAREERKEARSRQADEKKAP